MGGGGKWRGGWELRGEGGGAKQGGEVACEEESEGEEGKEGKRWDERGTSVGEGGKARKGHGETSWEVACSEDVRLEVRVRHDSIARS